METWLGLWLTCWTGLTGLTGRTGLTGLTGLAGLVLAGTEGLLVPAGLAGLAGRAGEGLVGLGTAGKGWPVNPGGGGGTLDPKLAPVWTLLDTEDGPGGGGWATVFPPTLLWTL